MTTCSFKQCHHGQLDESTARVEVCTALPAKGLGKLAPQLKVIWSKSGEAAFHEDCWNALVKVSRARNPKRALFTMTYAEKAMIKEALKTAEKHDSSTKVQDEGAKIAKMIVGAAHCIAFTGAGISTSAGIGDYRGKSGKWTEMDRQNVDLSEIVGADAHPSSPKRRRLSHASEESEREESDVKVEEGVEYEDLRPTYTHEALAKLHALGHLKHIISQNCDGLHLLSGIPLDNISELHGNIFVEKCEKCNKTYDRTYYVMDDHASLYYEELEDNGETDIIKPKHAKQCSLCSLNHRTGRKCEAKACNGFLMDTIINFRDNLEEPILEKACAEGRESDLILCLGTTLTVTPAADIVTMPTKDCKLIICNRQKTALDREAQDGGSRVFGDCDALMKEVMQNILPGDELSIWEEEKRDRIQQYDKQRPKCS